MRKKLKLATLDCETDPFKYGQIVQPFTWDFYDGENHFTFWGDSCTEELILFIVDLETKYEIYAHNGGKFDYMFLLKYMVNAPMTVIKTRIARWSFEGHTFKDSYSILPVPLKQSGNKQEFDYKKMTLGRRDKYKKEIISYMQQDCVALYDMVSEFKNNLGKGLTMAGVATRLLKEDTPRQIEKLSFEKDKDIRQFFFGGRVECFEKGIINDKLSINDVRSMYPSVMATELHPVSSKWVESIDFDDRADFVHLSCYSRGAFPVRTNNGLSFPHAFGEFRVTGHELRAALELKLVDIRKIIRSIRFLRKSTFEEFVLKYTNLRKQCTESGDEIGKLHYKLVQNSSYGRFALNPDKLFDWKITPPGQEMPEPWELIHVNDGLLFWRKPVSEQMKRRAISNVATGASITGAARAKLLYGIHSAERPIYCDTDSIICRNLNQPKDQGSLGNWQNEGSGNKIAVAGKKQYAVFGEAANDEKEKKKRLAIYGDEFCIKLASKGVRLLAPDIVKMAMGDVITWKNPAPSFSIDGKQRFIERRVCMT